MPILSYFVVVALVLVLHATGTLMILLKILGKVNPWAFMKKMHLYSVHPVLTQPIPVTLNATEKRLEVGNSTASFVVPFGATINMDGTAIMQGVATVFIANVYGIDLGLSGYLTVIGGCFNRLAYRA